jgi:quercetin dioxygenase-like cupin family protein
MEVLNVNEVKEFSKGKRVRKKLLGSDKLVAEFLCYEPGQSTPQHPHPKQDELFYVIEGRGVFIIDDKEIPVEESSLVLVPERVKHGISADKDSRLVVMFIKAPGATKSR